MECARCKKSFPKKQLRSPPRWLVWLAAPYFLLFASQSLKAGGALFGEAAAKYCPRCRRSVNAAIFFIAAMILIGLLAIVISYLIPADIRNAPIRRPAH